jgi:hypothetical protein
MTDLSTLVSTQLGDSAPVETCDAVGIIVRISSQERDELDLVSKFLGISRQRLVYSMIQTGYKDVLELIGSSGGQDVHSLFEDLAELEDEWNHRYANWSTT